MKIPCSVLCMPDQHCFARSCVTYDISDNLHHRYHQWCHQLGLVVLHSWPGLWRAFRLDDEVESHLLVSGVHFPQLWKMRGSVINRRVQRSGILDLGPPLWPSGLSQQESCSASPDLRNKELEIQLQIILSDDWKVVRAEAQQQTCLSILKPYAKVLSPQNGKECKRGPLPVYSLPLIQDSNHGKKLSTQLTFVSADKHQIWVGQGELSIAFLARGRIWETCIKATNDGRGHGLFGAVFIVPPVQFVYKVNLKKN